MTASVGLVLDTRPPVVTVTVPRTVEPPDLLEVRIEADEPLGVTSVALLDSLGRLFNLGYERTADRTILLSVPTLGLGTGMATLRINAADEVLNFTQVLSEVTVQRPRAFDVELVLGGVFEAVLTQGGALDASPTIDSAYAVSLSQGKAHEVVFTTDPAYQSSLEVS